MSYSLKLATAPAAEPISAAEAKAHMRISTSGEDALITSLIVAAREYCERLTDRAFINQTWEMWLDRFPVEPSRADWWDGVREEPISHSLRARRWLELPKVPLASVTSITTYADDSAQTATVFAATNYIVDETREPGRVVLNTNATWPVDLRSAKAIKVIFIAGYGASGASVPGPIKQAMLMLVAHWFENREAALVGSISKELEFATNQLLNSYRIIKL